MIFAQGNIRKLFFVVPVARNQPQRIGRLRLFGARMAGYGCRRGLFRQGGPRQNRECNQQEDYSSFVGLARPCRQKIGFLDQAFEALETLLFTCFSIGVLAGKLDFTGIKKKIVPDDLSLLCWYR